MIPGHHDDVRDEITWAPRLKVLALLTAELPPPPPPFDNTVRCWALMIIMNVLFFDDRNHDNMDHDHHDNGDHDNHLADLSLRLEPCAEHCNHCHYDDDDCGHHHPNIIIVILIIITNLPLRLEPCAQLLLRRCRCWQSTSMATTWFLSSALSSWWSSSSSSSLSSS